MSLDTQLHLNPIFLARDYAQKLFDEHIDEVRRIARRFAKKPFARDVHELDLVNVGLLGLIEAINRFNPQSLSRFTTFARIRIRGAMLDEIRREDSFTRTDRKWEKRIKRVNDELLRSLGREPTNEETATSLSMSAQDFFALQSRLERPEQSLEQLIQEKDVIGERVHDVFNFSTEDPLRQLLQLENSKLVLQAIEELKPTERLTLRLSFYENLPLTRIAELLGVTLSRVSQIRTEALKKMKTGLKRYH